MRLWSHRRLPAPPLRSSPSIAMTRSLIVVLLTLALGGCFLLSRSPDRPDASAVTGPPVYVEQCETCHAATVGSPRPASVHAGHGLHCGQCHAPAGHPDFVRPVQDTTCAGCHSAEYEQTLASRHFATRVERALDTDRAARTALRRAGFVAEAGGTRHFVSGRLCAACHYDGHKLGLDAVQREALCVGCHPGRDEHYPGPVPAGGNRCMECHVRIGETASGRVVTTHRFAMPGAESGGR